jgi:site-specific DNA-cytosine methylase
MKVGSLFAGIGGFDEGLRQTGMHSVFQVEKEPFCLKVLKTRFPNAQRAEDILTCRGLTSSVPASHVRIGRSRDRERDCADNVARSFTSLRESSTSFDPLGSSSRMFPDFSVVTTDETLRKSSGFSWSSAGMGFNGVCLTASFSESPSAAVVCSLSDVLESHAPQRFFLSAKAASGILRRAKKRGRTLPSRLQAALESLATRRGGEGRTISTSSQPSDPVEPDSKGQPETGTNQNSALLNQSTEVGPRADRDSEAADQMTTTAKVTGLLSVRRLTPTECEILQGFPKGWTLPGTELWGMPSPCPSSSG